MTTEYDPATHEHDYTCDNGYCDPAENGRVDERVRAILAYPEMELAYAAADVFGPDLDLDPVTVLRKVANALAEQQARADLLDVWEGLTTGPDAQPAHEVLWDLWNAAAERSAADPDLDSPLWAGLHEAYTMLESKLRAVPYVETD